MAMLNNQMVGFLDGSIFSRWATVVVTMIYIDLLIYILYYCKWNLQRSEFLKRDFLDGAYIHSIDDDPPWHPDHRFRVETAKPFSR